MEIKTIISWVLSCLNVVGWISALSNSAFSKELALFCAGVTGACWDGLGAEMRSVDNSLPCDAVSFKQRFAEQLFPMVQQPWPMPPLILGEPGACGHTRGDLVTNEPCEPSGFGSISGWSMRSHVVGCVPTLHNPGDKCYQWFLFTEELCDHSCIYYWWRCKVYTTFHPENLKEK